MKTESDLRIERMRNGEKIKCPRCENGFWAAVGDPKTTHVFRCDGCGSGMVLTVTALCDYEKKHPTAGRQKQE